jgi:hypothetical protein
MKISSFIFLTTNIRHTIVRQMYIIIKKIINKIHLYEKLIMKLKLQRDINVICFCTHRPTIPYISQIQDRLRGMGFLLSRQTARDICLRSGGP